MWKVCEKAGKIKRSKKSGRCDKSEITQKSDLKKKNGKLWEMWTIWEIQKMGAIVRNVVKMQGLHCKKIDATHLVSLKMIVSGVKTNKIIPMITIAQIDHKLVPDDHKLF